MLAGELPAAVLAAQCENGGRASTGGYHSIPSQGHGHDASAADSPAAAAAREYAQGAPGRERPYGPENGASARTAVARASARITARGANARTAGAPQSVPTAESGASARTASAAGLSWPLPACSSDLVTWLHIHIHTYTHTHIHTYTLTHIHTYAHSHTHTYTRVHTPWAHLHAYMWSARALQHITIATRTHRRSPQTRPAACP